ncbi:MAG TPA: UpxY family transcription antiterminator [Terriglobia bacterium]|nr:UpxY family transcription antiterminator [Terriglobia bacterium]
MQSITYMNEPIPAYAGVGFLLAPDAWFAVHTRSKCEKKVATQLDDMQIKSFLPIVKEIRSWSDRRKVIDQPLFPGYVFVRIPSEDRVRISVLRTNGVVGFVGVQGQGIPIPDTEIENIQTLLSSRVPFEPYPFLRVGEKVRIRGGYLDGIEGILAAKNSDQSVVISIDLIQRSLAVRVSGFDLEPIR